MDGYVKTRMGVRACSEGDVDVLRMLFPTLDRSDAAAVLTMHGSIERAASVLVEVEVVDDGAEPTPDSPDCGELPAYIRCPKCFSPDVLQPETNGLLVCGKCMHHFRRAQAKKGASRGINAPAQKKKKKKKPEVQEVQEVALPPEPCPAEDGAAVGPVQQRLNDNRARSQGLLRLVVSHAGCPKEKRVITVPKDDAYNSLMKQARAKFRLRKPLKGVRVLPESIPLEPAEVADLADGVEVLVTLVVESRKKRDRAASQEVVAVPAFDTPESSAASQPSSESLATPPVEPLPAPVAAVEV